MTQKTPPDRGRRFAFPGTRGSSLHSTAHRGFEALHLHHSGTRALGRRASVLTDTPGTGTRSAMSIYAALTCTLAADAEQRTAKSGRPWTRLRVSVGDGDDRTWLSVSCFGDLADDASHFVKGDVIHVEGSIRLNRWTGQNGIEKSEMAVSARYIRRAEIGINRPKKSDKPIEHSGDTYHSPRSAPANRISGAGRPFDDTDGIPFSPEVR